MLRCSETRDTYQHWCSFFFFRFGFQMLWLWCSMPRLVHLTFLLPSWTLWSNSVHVKVNTVEARATVEGFPHIMSSFFRVRRGGDRHGLLFNWSYCKCEKRPWNDRHGPNISSVQCRCQEFTVSQLCKSAAQTHTQHPAKEYQLGSGNRSTCLRVCLRINIMYCVYTHAGTAYT